MRHYAEVKCHVAGASGTIEVHLDGVVEIASTIGNFGSANIGAVGFWGGTSPPQYCDIYVLDTGGTVNNDFLGDCRIETLLPTADGANTAWAPSAAGSHFSKVDEASGTYPDGDTTYVSDGTPGDRDTYVMADLSSTGGLVFGVRTKIYARKDDAPTRQVARVFRQSGTNYDGTTQTLTTSYAPYSQIDEQDPSTGAQWTVAGVNSVEVGVKAVA